MERNFRRPRFDRGGDRSGGFRGGGFRDRGNFPKPVEEGQEFDVEITEVGTKGDGITRVKNFVIFVPDTKEGEKCRIKIKMVRPKFAVAEKVSEGGDLELEEPVKDELKEETKPEETEEEVTEEIKEEIPEEKEKIEKGEEVDEDK